MVPKIDSEIIKKQQQQQQQHKTYNIKRIKT